MGKQDSAAAIASAPGATSDAKAPILKAPTKKFRPEHAERFFEWQDTIPQAEWSHLGFHLYRLWPVIIRPQGEKNIQQLVEPLKRDNLLRKWGAGKYWAVLNDSNRGKYGEVCQITINLQDNWDEYPPVIGDGDLDMNHPDNLGYIQWARAKGLMKMASPTAAPANDSTSAALVELLKGLLAQKAQTNPAEAKAIETVMNMMNEGHKQSLALVQSQAIGNDPFTLLEKAKGLFGGGSNDVMALILPILLKDVLPLVITRLTAPPVAAPAATSEMGQFERFLGLMEMVEARVGGNKSGATTWPAVAELAVTKIPETLQHLTQLFRVLGSTPVRPPQPGVVIDAPAGLPQGPNPNPAASASQATPQEQPMDIRPMLPSFGPPLIAALKREEDGSELAEAISKTFGLETFEAVAALGKKGILEALQSSPELWASLKPFTEVVTTAGKENRLDLFVEEFIAFGDPMPAAEAAE